MRCHVGMRYVCGVRIANVPVSTHPSTSMFEPLLTRDRDQGQSSGHAGRSAAAFLFW
jgi:hypothetical protein